MAFIFNPNPSEGDKQTNPDTGVEYIYSGGAWRALGPKIEDEFDTLDERYIKLNGRSDVGDAYTIKGPGETTGATSTFHQIKDGKQYLYHIDTPQDSNTGWVANVSYVKSKTDDRMTKQGTQTINSEHWKIIQPNQTNANRTFVDIYDGSMNLYNVADPTDGADGWAANKKYVNDVAAAYLPLAGGNLTGDVETTGKFVLDHGTGNTASKKLHIIGETADGTDQDLFWSYKNADGTLDAVNYKGKMDSDFNLVNKGYVDTEVAKAIDQTHSDNATQAFWYFASHQTAENLQPGEFFISDINEHLYLHTTSANGVDLGVGSSERVFNIATLFSVHATNGNSMYCAKSDRINFGSGSNNYMRVAQDTVFFKQQLNQGTKYVLNIPGFTP